MKFQKNKFILITKKSKIQNHLLPLKYLINFIWSFDRSVEKYLRNDSKENYFAFLYIEMSCEQQIVRKCENFHKRPFGD